MLYEVITTALASAAAEEGNSRESLLPWGRAWYEWISSSFIRACLAAAAGAAFLPAADIGFVLDIYLLKKAFYELKYEMNNRPDWLHIPLTGIVDILDRKANRKRKNNKG